MKNGLFIFQNKRGIYITAIPCFCNGNGIVVCIIFKLVTIIGAAFFGFRSWDLGVGWETWPGKRETVPFSEGVKE